MKNIFKIQKKILSIKEEVYPVSEIPKMIVEILPKNNLFFPPRSPFTFDFAYLSLIYLENTKNVILYSIIESNENIPPKKVNFAQNLTEFANFTYDGILYFVSLINYCNQHPSLFSSNPFEYYLHKKKTAIDEILKNTYKKLVFDYQAEHIYQIFKLPNTCKIDVVKAFNAKNEDILCQLKEIETDYGKNLHDLMIQYMPSKLLYKPNYRAAKMLYDYLS